MKYQIKMLSTARGVDDGEIHAKQYTEGETVEVGESLAKAFQGMGVCKILGEAAIEAATAPEPEETPTDLTKMNKAQLLETAAAHGVVVDETASKKDIIAAIEAATA